MVVDVGVAVVPLCSQKPRYFVVRGKQEHRLDWCNFNRDRLTDKMQRSHVQDSKQYKFTRTAPARSVDQDHPGADLVAVPR